MSDNNNKIIFDLKSNSSGYGSLMPSYMRSISTILQAKEEILKVSWEKEGKEVLNNILKIFYIYKFFSHINSYS
jgi:hypothetical protein